MNRIQRIVVAIGVSAFMAFGLRPAAHDGGTLLARSRGWTQRDALPPDRKPPGEDLPRQPAKDVRPPEKPQTPDHGAIARQAPGGAGTESGAGLIWK